MGDDALIYALSRIYSANNRRATKVAVTVVDVSDAGWHASRLLHPGSRKREKLLGIDAVREVTEKLNEHARLVVRKLSG